MSKSKRKLSIDAAKASQKADQGRTTDPTSPKTSARLEPAPAPLSQQLRSSALSLLLNNAAYAPPSGNHNNADNVVSADKAILATPKGAQPRQHSVTHSPAIARGEDNDWKAQLPVLTARGTPRKLWQRPRRDPSTYSGDPRSEANRRSKIVNGRVPQELREQFIAAAQKLGVSQSEAMAQAIRLFLKENGD